MRPSSFRRIRGYTGEIPVEQMHATDAAINTPNPRFRTENGLGSVEGFVRVFNCWKKGEPGDTRPTLVVYDELKSFVDKAVQKGSTLLPFLTSMFEGEDYDNTTTRQQVSVRGCHIGLLGACTLETFADMWTPEFTSIGFPNRLFLVKGDPHQRISVPQYPSNTEVERMKIRAFSLVDKIRARHANGQGTISLAPKAKSRWHDFYLSCMPRSIHAKRLDTYSLKWMMLLSLSQEEFEISDATVDRAIDLFQYQFEVRKLYDPIDADNKFAEMEEKIRRVVRGAAPNFVSRSELMRRTNGSRLGIYMFDTAISNLVGAQEIQQEGTKRAWKWSGGNE